MRVKVNKMGSASNIKAVSVSISKQLQIALRGLLTELTLSSKKHLNRTLAHAEPRTERDAHGQYGLGNARVHVRESIFKKTHYGGLIMLNVMVEKKGTGTPHKVWHRLNKGASPKTVSRRVNYPLRETTRTSVGDLDARAFDGYKKNKKGRTEWRSSFVKPQVIAREWYSSALDQVLAENPLIDEFTNYKIEAND